MKFAQLSDKPAGGKIGLTPLIDVVFILLLFFMLTSTFAVRRNMDMATPSTSLAQDQLDKVISLELGQDGLIIEGHSIGLDDIYDRLHFRLELGDPVSLLVADDIPLETTVEVMDVLKAAGARAIALRSPDTQS
jgi:biopolymer transport protein ExbD